MRLLLATSDHQLHTTLARLLHRANYLFDSVTTAADTLAYAETCEYDGLLLDNTLAASPSSRSCAGNTSPPPRCCSPKAAAPAIITALDAGADDCLTKPFTNAELLAHLRAILRRRPTYTPDLLSAYGLTLDRTACTLHHADRSCRLSGKEYQILEMLLTTPGVILPTDKLIAHIWGWDSNISMNTLWVHISNLRKKLSQLQAPAHHPLHPQRRLCVARGHATKAKLQPITAAVSFSQNGKGK